MPQLNQPSNKTRAVASFASLLLATCFLQNPALAQYTPTEPATISTQLVASGLDSTTSSIEQIFPTDLEPFPDDSRRLLVTTLGGLIRLIDLNDSLLEQPYLNTTSADTINADNGNSSFGLTTVAFHPDFAVIGAIGFGRLYTIEAELTRSNPPPDFPGVGSDQGGSNPAHDRILYEYTTSDVTANQFTGSKREVLRIHEHRRGHDVNDLAFDEDGYLLIAVGDTVSSGTAQDLSNVFGTILRIDPLDPAVNSVSPDPVSNNGRYRIPLNNPFLAEAMALDEIYIYGLRNPFRIAVDSTNQLWVSSNGATQRESVYAANSGDNLGWPWFEGSRPNQSPPMGFAYQPPIFEYDHSLGRSVTGVLRYEGTAVAALTDRIVFADFLGAGGGARLFHGDASTGSFSDVVIDPASSQLPSAIVSLGRDQAGELYVLGTDGTVSRLQSVTNDVIFRNGFEP